MKNNLFLFYLMFFTLGAFSQTVIKKDSIRSVSLDATLNGSRVMERKMIPVGNPCKDCTVLVIHNQKWAYSTTVKAVTDTLAKQYTYTVHVDRKTIQRYTDDRNIKKILLIEYAK